MKKIVSLLCAALCLTLLLAACGAKVPEGMEEEKVKAAAEATVKQLDARDYEALMDTMKDLIVDALGALTTSIIGYVSLKYKKGWIEKLQIKRKKSSEA